MSDDRCLDGCKTLGDCKLYGCLKLHLRNGLAKYAGWPNTPEVHERVYADLVDLYRSYGDGKR